MFSSMIDEEKVRIVNSIHKMEPERRANLKGMTSNLCVSSPSHYLKDIFMLKYKQQKEAMKEFIENTEAASISMDHTFKLSKCVTIPFSKGHSYSKACAALLIILNEKGDVISFKLTVDESLKDESVSQMFLKVKEISPHISLVMVDNCCHVRNIIQEVFDEADVKLDLFHGFSRVTRTLAKKNIPRREKNLFKSQFKDCFRQKDDLGNSRLKPTCSSD